MCREGFGMDGDVFGMVGDVFRMVVDEVGWKGWKYI